MAVGRFIVGIAVDIDRVVLTGAIKLGIALEASRNRSVGVDPLLHVVSTRERDVSVKLARTSEAIGRLLGDLIAVEITPAPGIRNPVGDSPVQHFGWRASAAFVVGAEIKRHGVADVTF